jgi:hypothetical protein
MSRSAIVILTLTATTVLAPVQGAVPESVSTAGAAFQANLDSFDRLTCEYTLTYGGVKSVEDAIAGQFLAGSQVGKGKWMKRGQYSIIRFEEDPATTKALDAPKLEPYPGRPGVLIGPGYPFETKRFLSNGKDELDHTPRRLLANLTDDKNSLSFSDYPFSALWYGDTEAPLDVLIRQAARGEVPCEAKWVLVEGRKCLEVLFVPTTGVRKTITLDAERGFLPVRIRWERPNQPPFMRLDITQVRACPNGRWFPERILFFESGAAGKPNPIYECKVLSLDVETLPSKDEFALELPAGTMIRNPFEKGQQFKTRRPERIHADDLGHVFKMTEEVPKTPLMDTAIEPPKRNRWVWWAVGGGAAAVLILGALLIRHRGRTVPTPVQS